MRKGATTTYENESERPPVIIERRQEIGRIGYTDDGEPILYPIFHMIASHFTDSRSTEADRVEFTLDGGHTFTVTATPVP